MQTEYEATFENVDKELIRKKLITCGAKLIKKEFIQKRVVFSLPNEKNTSGSWLRVRDEGDKITLSYKSVKNFGKIDEQKEIQLKVDNFENACELLIEIGCVKKAYQESKRELWFLNGVEITIDEWPFLEPFIEIEGNSEMVVKNVSEILGFDYKNAYFGAVDGLYSKKYGITQDRINNQTPEILFDMDKNPFIK